MNFWRFFWCNSDLNLSLEICLHYELFTVFVIITLFLWLEPDFTVIGQKGSFHTLSHLGHTVCNNLNLEETGKILIVDCTNPHIFSFHIHYAQVIFLQVWQSHNKPETRQSKRDCSWSLPVTSQTPPHDIIWCFERFYVFLFVRIPRYTATRAEPRVLQLTHEQLQ